MKKKINRVFLMLCFSLLPMLFMTACDHDTNSYLDVLVVDEATKKPLPGVTVETYQHNRDTTDFNYRRGVTGADGIFSTYYGVPGIMSIYAQYNLPVETGGYRSGTGTVRVIEGETKTVQVILETAVHY